ncbi:reprolysin family zinc metalloprotease [Trichinella spiralis]|uniref:reprolysin family zinc metalloprotease n=1 Tax=Trichinella spiralis TaxID=6334 RepID=UPI0001EFB33D|nr:reprolysin family zinc metalloprotease [Trichinella spiralis]
MAPTNNFDFHVIYKRQTTSGSFFYPSATFCGVDTSFERTMRDDPTKMKKHHNNWNAPPGSTQFHHDRLVMELAIFIDNELWLRYSRKYGDQAEDKLKDFIYTVFHHVQILYQQPSIEPLIEFSIVRYEIFKTQPKALKGTKHNHGSALSYLNAFCKFQYYLGARKRWDFALLFSGYDIHRPPSDRTISGIARLYGVCDPLNSCLLAEGVDFSSAYIAAHEIGHGLGMLHDEPTCSSDYIMSGSLGAGKVQWSSCSVQSLNNYIRKLELWTDNGQSGQRWNVPAVNVHLYPQDWVYFHQHEAVLIHLRKMAAMLVQEAAIVIFCEVNGTNADSISFRFFGDSMPEGSPCGEGHYCINGKCLMKILLQPRQQHTNGPVGVNGQNAASLVVAVQNREAEPVGKVPPLAGLGQEHAIVDVHSANVSVPMTKLNNASTHHAVSGMHGHFGLHVQSAAVRVHAREHVPALIHPAKDQIEKLPDATYVLVNLMAFGMAGLNGPHVQSVAVLVFDNETASVQPETVMASHTCQNNASFPVAQSGVRGDSGPSVVRRVELDNGLDNATGLAHVWARTLSPKHVNLATGGQNGAHGLCVPVLVAKVYDVDIVLASVLSIPALEISKFSKYVTKKTALMLIWVMLRQHCPHNLLPVCTLSATNGASGVIAWDAVVQAFEKGFAFVKDITAVRLSLQNLSIANCCHATQYFTLDH